MLPVTNKNKTSGELKQTYHIDNAEASPNKNENTITTSSATPDLHSFNSQQISSETENKAKYNPDTSNLNHASQEMKLTLTELAERLGKNPQTVKNMIYKQKDRFAKWSQKLDPSGIAWQRYGTGKRRKGEVLSFIPFTQTIVSESNQQENSGVIENGI